MIAFLEPVAFILRVCAHEATGGSMPWPYLASATVTVDEMRVATLRGATMSGGVFQARDPVLDALGRIGATDAVWSRRAGGQIRIMRARVPNPGPVLYL